jgi:outer membrane protein W
MKARFIAVVAVLIATAAQADDHLTIFVSDLGYESARTTTTFSDGTTAFPVTRKVSEWNGGIGVAFSHAWNARWSTEGSVTFDRHHMTTTRFVNSAPFTAREGVNTMPADLMMRFHFPNDSRWQPYVAAGAHYVAAPSATVASFNGIPNENGLFPVTVRSYGNRFSAQAGIGTTFRITPRVGLQFDVKRLLSSDEAVPFDPKTRGSFGVSWKF